jgi:hypothetical protein
MPILFPSLPFTPHLLTFLPLFPNLFDFSRAYAK